MNVTIREQLSASFNAGLAPALTSAIFPGAWNAFTHPAEEAKGAHGITRIGQVQCGGVLPTKVDLS